MRTFAFSMAACVALLAGCGPAAPPTHEVSAAEQHALNLVEDAKHAVVGQLKDPDSAQWGAFWTPDGQSVCGYVNAKNSLGGFAGSRLFVALNRSTAVIDGDAEGAAAFAKYITACKAGSKELLASGQPSPF